MGARELALLAALALMWAASFTFIKIAVATVPPATIVAGRLAVAAVLLWAYLALTGRRLPRPGRAWRLYGVLAVTGNTLPFLLIAWAETRVDSGLAAILIGTVPVITVLLAHRLSPDEPLGAHTWAGVALGLAALVVLAGPHALAGLGGTLLAQVALVGAAASYALNGLLVRRIRADVVSASAAVLVASAALALPISLALDRPWQLAPSWAAVWAVLAQGAFSTALATIAFFHLVTVAGAAATSFVNYLIPAVAVALGVVWLGERPGWPELAALALILAGLALVNRRRARRPART